MNTQAFIDWLNEAPEETKKLNQSYVKAGMSLKHRIMALTMNREELTISQKLDLGRALNQYKRATNHE